MLAAADRRGRANSRPAAIILGMRTFAVAAWVVASAAIAGAQRGGGPFPGGTNPDGSLRPSAPVSRLFTQDAYTEYALLEPGSAAFRIRYLFETARAGATEM